MFMRQLILHVEDEPDDAMFVAMAFNQAGGSYDIFLAKNGEQAIKYLSGDGHYADRARHPVPHLLLLDLKLPGMSGFEVLAWARAQDQYREMPIIVLSGSELDRDKEQALRLGANSYFIKTPFYGDVVDFADAFFGHHRAAR